MCGFDNGWMVCQTKIIVRAKVEHCGSFAIVANIDGCLLRAGDEPLLLEKSLVLECLRSLGEGGQKFGAHGFDL